MDAVAAEKPSHAHLRKEATMQGGQNELNLEEQALKSIRHHVYGSAGVGLIPIAIVDLVGLMAVQLNLVRRLARIYDIPFSKDVAKHIIGTLVGSYVPTTVSFPFASLMKMIPVIGQVAGALTMPAFASASTYAIGKVFLQHFASGGTFLTFDPDKVKDFYAQMFKEGEKVAQEAEEKKKTEKKAA